jgi:hypothetical protein
VTEWDRRILVLLLRVAGVVTVTAFLAMFLPVEWMAATHRWLGMGEFPRSPVVDYLKRSVARDPERYATIVRYLGVMNVLLGAFLVVIDLHAAMPVWWTLGEGPPIIVFGALILFFSRSLVGASLATTAARR